MYNTLSSQSCLCLFSFSSHRRQPRMIIMGLLFLRFRIFLPLLFIHLVTSETVHIGILLPLSRPGFSELGRNLQLAVNPAIQDVYNHNTLKRDWNITYTIKDSGCHKTLAVGRTYELHNADVFIGPACSDSCLSAALLASYWNKPMISYSCSSVELSNRGNFPTFARTQPFSRTYSEESPDILYHAMLFYKWKRAAIISTEDYIWTPIATSMASIFQRNNISVSFKGFYAPSSTFSYKAFLSQVRSEARGESLTTSVRVTV